MLLSARFLNDVQNVNSFEPTNNIEFHKGSAQTIYLQLIDKSLDLATQGFNPSGRRFVPQPLSTLVLQFVNVENSKKILRPATQPFVGDGSIWSAPVFGTDPLDGTVTIIITLTQPDGQVLVGTINAGMLVC